MKTVRIHYYSQDWNGGIRNLGDWLTVPVLAALGYRSLPPAADSPLLFGIGSIVGHCGYYPKSPITVWGSGVLNPVDDVQDFRNHSRVECAAVRSEMTRDVLGLSDRTPLGYPSTLLPSLVKLPAVSAPGTVYVHHCGSENRADPKGFDTVLSAAVHQDDALSMVSQIAAAEFVASASMHGCVLAAVYGVPWAPAARTPGPAEWKWSEWFHYCGLDPGRAAYQPADLHVCRNWWSRVGRKARLRDPRPLLDAFPHNLAQD